MSEVTQHLESLRAGDEHARTALLECVYAELRQLARAKMARELPGHTLQPTGSFTRRGCDAGGGGGREGAHISPTASARFSQRCFAPFRSQSLPELHSA